MGGAADADGDVVGGVGLVGEAAVFYGAANLLGDGVGAEAVGVGEDDDELFSAVACEEVGGALDDGVGGLGDDAEALVALEVSVEIVVAFEEVHVEDEERDGGVIAHGSAPLLIEDFVEAAAVGDAGETVEGGEAFGDVDCLVELVFGGFAGGDVADDVDEANGLSGDGVAVETDVGFDPEVGAVFVEAAVGEDVEVGASAALIEELFEGGDVFGMDDLVVGVADELFGVPSEDLGSGRGDVAAASVEVGEDDDVAGDLGEEPEAGFAGLEVELEAAALGLEDLNDVEEEHGDSDEELEDKGALSEGGVGGEGDGAVVGGGEEASDDADDEQTEG